MIFLALKPSNVVYFMLINFKIPTIVGIFTFLSMIKFMLSCVAHDTYFVTLEPGLSEPLLVAYVKSTKSLMRRLMFSWGKKEIISTFCWKLCDLGL